MPQATGYAYDVDHERPIYRLSIRLLDRVSTRIRRTPYFANVSPAVRALHCALFRKADLLHEGEIVPELIFFIHDAFLPMSQCRGPHDCWRRAAKIRTARVVFLFVVGFCLFLTGKWPRFCFFV